MERRTIRVGAVVLALAATLAVGAATATVSTSMAPSLRLRAQALERAHILPHGFFSLTTVLMQTAPVDVVRNGVTYSMSVTVFGDPGFGSSLDVGLSRAQADGRAFQAHDYGFSPQSGINLSYDRKTIETATLDTTTAISPSQITRLVHRDVGEGETVPAVRRPHGNAADGEGNNDVERVRRRHLDGAVLRHDPHPARGRDHRQGSGLWGQRHLGSCQRREGDPQGGVGDRRGRLPRARRAPVLPEPALGAKVGAGRFFGFEKAYRDPEIFELGLRQRQVPPDEFEFHLIEAFAGRNTLPKPVKVGPGRFEAAIRSEGGEFMNGSATFTSGPPAVRTGLVCRAGPRLRHFNAPHVPRHARARRVAAARRVRHAPARSARGHAGDVRRPRLRPAVVTSPRPG